MTRLINKAYLLLIFVAVSSYVGLALSLLVGQLTSVVSFLSWLIALGFCCWLNEKQNTQALHRQWDAYIFLVFALVCYYAFSHYFYYNDSFFWTWHANNLGDVPLHIHIIRFLGRGADFWPKNPIYASDLLRYPFGMDFFNAMFERIGVDLSAHLFLVGFILSLVLLACLYNWMGLWGLCVFFLNGGAANWRILSTLKVIDYQNAEAWKNLFLSVWITQRGFLYALPAGVWILHKALAAACENKSLSQKEKISFAILLAALPFFHLHSFVLILGFLLALQLFYRQLFSQRAILYSCIFALLLSLPFVWVSTDAFSRAGVIHLGWNWTQSSGPDAQTNVVLYWFKNFGIWCGLAPLALVLARSRRSTRFWAGVVAAVFFVVFANVMLAPWNWDNIKLLIWCYLLLSWFVYHEVYLNLNESLKMFVGLCCFFSGGMAIFVNFMGVLPPTQIYRAQDLNAAASQMREIPINKVVLAKSEYNSPMSFLGYPLVMGYEGHLWSHGYDYSNTKQKLDEYVNKMEANQEASTDLSYDYEFLNGRLSLSAHQIMQQSPSEDSK